MLRGLWTLPTVAECRGWGITKFLANSVRLKNDKNLGASSMACLRCYSDSSEGSDKKEEQQQPSPGQVFKHERHNMYVCWHPEVPFPYEMTKPIDLAAPVEQSNLKIQALTPVREAFRQKSEKLMIQELVKLTYSTKHRFYGKFGMKRRTYLQQIDPKKQRRHREYL